WHPQGDGRMKRGGGKSGGRSPERKRPVRGRLSNRPSLLGESGGAYRIRTCDFHRVRVYRPVTRRFSWIAHSGDPLRTVPRDFRWLRIPWEEKWEGINSATAR